MGRYQSERRLVVERDQSGCTDNQEGVSGGGTNGRREMNKAGEPAEVCELTEWTGIES